MATELVLLSEIPATFDMVRLVMTRVCGVHSTLIEFRGGELMSVLDTNHARLVTLHAPKVIQLPEEARAALLGPPPSAFGLWTEVVIPHGAPPAAHVLANAIAAEVRGELRERV